MGRSRWTSSTPSCRRAPTALKRRPQAIPPTRWYGTNWPARTREESTLNVTFLTFLCLACLIAAVGVVTDSPVTVVGAMVVGPEFGPLAALAVALVRRKTYLARRAALALLVGFPIAMLVTAIGVLAGEAVGWIDVDQHPRA